MSGPLASRTARIRPWCVISHTAVAKILRNRNLQARWNMAGSTQVGNPVVDYRVTHESPPRDGI